LRVKRTAMLRRGKFGVLTLNRHKRRHFAVMHNSAFIR
jgi:hypothetical protein